MNITPSLKKKCETNLVWTQFQMETERKCRFRLLQEPIQNWQRNKETTRAILEPFQKESWAVGLRKGNDELKAGVNRFIKAYREEGGFEHLGERYFKEMKDEFKRLGSAFFL